METCSRPQGGVGLANLPEHIAFYGSKATPKAIFGEDTPEINAFYQAAQTVAPGAWELLQDLLASWQPYALLHQWKLPDGFDARVKVMQKRKVRIEVDELNHTTFTYEFYENEGTEKGLSNAANVVHSMDAYVLREMHRRCNYDYEMIQNAFHLISSALDRPKAPQEPIDPKLAYYLEQWDRSTLLSAVILPHINETNVHHIPVDKLNQLYKLVDDIYETSPFPLVTVHDEFKAHPNNLNRVRYWYKEILAEIADSRVLDDILSQIHGMPGTFNKLSTNLGDLIRKSNYGLT